MRGLDLKNKKIARRRFRTRYRLKKVSKGGLRLSVFKSNKHFYAQLIDDSVHRTLLSASSIKMNTIGKNGVDVAKQVGFELGKKIVDAGINRRFYLDRGQFLYHGKVAAFAEGVREAGVKF